MENKESEHLYSANFTDESLVNRTHPHNKIYIFYLPVHKLGNYNIANRQFWATRFWTTIFKSGSLLSMVIKVWSSSVW